MIFSHIFGIHTFLRYGHFVEYMNMHAMNMQLAVVVGADWTLHSWRHNSSNVGVSRRARRDRTQVMLGVSLRDRWDTTLVRVI